MTLIYRIQPENFDREVMAETRPVLVLCMPRDDQFPQQLKIIEEIAANHDREIKVGLVQEEFIEAFKKKYLVIGTPTILILEGGKEKGRILGLANGEMLTDLIANSKRPFLPEKA
ncbi:MAG: hypothetical protein AB1585_08765 [Thermodesulfobacteriota bacterium]